MQGDWNLPLATTTRSKVSVVPECSTSHPLSPRLRSSTRVSESDAGRQGECLRIAMQVGEDVTVRREDQIALVLEVAEGGEGPAGVGVHGRPYAADAVQPGPLTAQHRALLEDRRLESLRQQPTCRDEAAGARPDHRNASCHLPNSGIDVNYAQCRGGNVVRFLRRSQPGVSGVRRRAGRACLRRADGLPRRAVLDHARVQGLFRSARHVLSRRDVRQGRKRAVGPHPQSSFA